MTQKIKLRWVLAHIPYDLFLRSASIFSRTVNERSNGLVEIEVLGLDEYQEKYNNGQAIDRYAVLDMVNDGIIEMSQMHSTQLGRINQDLRVLDLPFLFENHEHAVRVLDGEIGQNLLSDLAKNSNVRGLAFTYSGGFRMVVANKPITRVEDLAGERVRVAFSPVAEDTFSTVGATPVPMSVNQTGT
jgi:TRAP-type C4-dicarboxylate transport system substrate-binding protein